MNRANVVIRDEYGFKTSDDRCVWFWGDILRTKQIRKEARNRYDRLIKLKMKAENDNETKKTQVKIPDGKIGKHDISPLGRHAKKNIHKTDSVSGLFDGLQGVQMELVKLD